MKKYEDHVDKGLEKLIVRRWWVKVLKGGEWKFVEQAKSLDWWAIE